MSENGTVEQILSDDVSRDDVFIPDFQPVTATGTITKFERKMGGGHVFGELTIEYLNGGDQKQTIHASIWENREGETTSDMAKEQYDAIMLATDTNNLNQIVGRRVKFTAVANKKRPKTPSFKSFAPPE